MKIDELAHKYSTYHSDLELIHYSEVAFPVWRLNLGVTMQQELSISVVDEFVLKLVDSGLEKIENISGVLGLDEVVVKKSAVFLMKNELIRLEQKTQSIILTEKGKGMLEGIKLVVPEQRSFSFFINGITGQYCSLESAQLYPANLIKNQRVHSIHPSKQVPMPTDQTIEFNLFELFIRGLNEKGYSAPQGRLFEINGVEKVFTMFIKLRVLTYHQKGTDNYQYLVFDRDTHASEYDGLLLNLEKNEKINILPLEEYIPALDIIYTIPIVESRINEASANLDELKKVEYKLEQFSQETKSTTLSKKAREELLFEIDSLRNQLDVLKNSTRLIRTFEHRPLLEKSLSVSKKWVVIVSPWLSPDAFDDDLMARIEKSLQRGIKILILYGYPQELPEKKKREEKMVLDKLLKIKSKKYGKLLFHKNIGITHEKVLICDNSFIVVGSFNWLSFRGNALRGLRLEKSVYTESKDVIKDALNDIIHYGELESNTFRII